MRIAPRTKFLPYDAVPPIPVQGLAVVSFTAHTATLAWTPNPDGDIAYYQLEQSNDAGANYSQIFSGLQTSRIAIQLRPGWAYRFRVRAVDQSNNQGLYGTPLAYAAPTPTVAATVPIYDLNGNLTGYRPSRSLNGAFYGRTDLGQGDLWCFTSISDLLIITELPGGDFSATGPAATYVVPWDVYDASAPTTYIRGSYTMTLT